ncbi:hypothetical protein EDF73_11159 [Raoultella sp. BIGb0138]|uniref:hypothetical protein n=1 Tax=Raoultella sp. BIGb0138 TaxID=2485115 RepID=UPI001044F2CF|nr:hypothetical protein [Raoultella sp. BIGb0138]TCW08536.1 hypothetical protein EDF73_11159 [Raoultella sp. BIGb0138]
MDKKIVLALAVTFSTPALAETDYDKAVNAYLEYICDYNTKSLIKEGSKTPYKELIIACKKGADDIRKFITDWPDFGTNEGIITFQRTVAPYAHEGTAESAYKDQIYQYGAGSWGIGYIQSPAAKANTIRQWKQGKFKVK